MTTSHRRLVLSALALLTFAPSNHGSEHDLPDAPFASAIATSRHAIVAVMAEHAIPGMSISVIEGSEIIWSQAFGSANLEQGVAAHRATKFYLGSVSKLFTTAIAARMVDQGLVEWDTHIRDYRPSLPEHYNGITLRHLGVHLSGIRHYSQADFDFTQPASSIDLRHYPTMESKLALFVEDPLLFEPGAQSQYSTYAFTVMAAVLESASGENFADLLQRYVAQPLGINVVPAHPVNLIEHRTIGYQPAEWVSEILPDAEGPVIHAMPANPQYKYAGGGLLSDADSLARFGAAFFAPGFLSDKTYQEMLTEQERSDGSVTGLGITWRLGTDADERSFIHHSGNVAGGRSHLVVYPDNDLALALVSNLTGRPGDISSLAQQIADAFLSESVGAQP